MVLLSVGLAPSSEIRKQVSQIDSLISKAGNLFRAKKFDESSLAIKEAQEKFEKVAGSGGKDSLPLLDESFKRLQKAHTLLELEGYELSPLKPAADIQAAASDPSAVRVPSGPVSFINHVGPLLISKCGRCHINDSKGMFSMSTFASLIKGPREGKVIFPGDAGGSRLIEVIESGDMPRGGLKVTAEELTILKNWITEGAKFDGKGDQEPLTSLVPAVKPSAPPETQITKSLGTETVSFSNDLARVFAKQCTACHGARQPRENFRVTNFQSLLQGGDSGPAIIPGNPEESLLIKKLKGTGGGQRMPAGRQPLDDELMAKMETWIKEGATLDASDPTMELGRVAVLAKALRASHDELSRDREQSATGNWQLAMPSVAATCQSSKNFLVCGSSGPNTLAHVSETAESLVPKIAAIFKAESEAPLLKGRLTLFVFEQRFDYTEFGQMVEKRDLPKDWRCHWQYDVVDAYAAMILPRDKAESIDGLLAHPIAAAYVASLGDMPRWFAEGCGRIAAARLDGTDKRVVATQEAIPEAIAASTKPDDFINGKLSQELRDAASYSFVSFLMTDAKNFSRLLDAIREGAAFDQAFTQVYKGSPNQVAEVWVKRPAGQKLKNTKGSKKG